MACYNISVSYKDSGALPRALEAACEALRIWQVALPPEHEDVTDAEKLARDLQQAMVDDDDDDEGEQALRKAGRHEENRGGGQVQRSACMRRVLQL
jgi:hypothetical protein